MKLFLSDLHLSDGKERDDFQYHQQFDEVVRTLSEEFKRVEIILLGDIFDLIRTQKYCELEDLPHPEVKLKVMEEILENHARFFETLRLFAERPDHQLRYIIGNHDFGACLDHRLVEEMARQFGIILTPENHYRDKDLGIWAEHGHRYDALNSTFNRDGTPIHYCLGDKIVVEIVDRFHEEARERQSELGVDPAIINDLDNVRPQTSIPDWLDSIDDEGRLRQVYYDTTTRFIADNLGEVGNLAWDYLSGRYQPDLLKAAGELAKKGVGKYIIFGHTHDAAMKGLAGGAQYLNSGTWRKFIEPRGRYTKRKTVPTYVEGGTQLYEEEVVYRYKFKSIVNLGYIMFYEKGEGGTGPHLVYQKQEVPDN